MPMAVAEDVCRDGRRRENGHGCMRGGRHTVTCVDLYVGGSIWAPIDVGLNLSSRAACGRHGQRRVDVDGEVRIVRRATCM